MTNPQSIQFRLRRGSSYLEVQVAMVLLSIGISGLYSISVVQTRQTARLQEMLPSDEVASINPVSTTNPAEAAWAKKLGVYADIQTDSVAAPVTTYPLNTGFVKIVDNEDTGDYWTHRGWGAPDWFQYTGSLEKYEDSISVLQTSGSHGSFAEFIARNIPPGEYEVLLFCARISPCGSAVPHQIYDGPQLIDTVSVNQRVADNDFYYDSHWWQRLGVYTFHNSEIRVRMLDSPDTGDYVIADAIMIRCRRSFSVTSPVEATTSGGATVTVDLN
ncbi:MAG: hypothetical protein KDB00_18195 [Planctomycetales bacterium]|nr:hypothetical protein [Planctomycetales bacterium]